MRDLRDLNVMFAEDVQLPDHVWKYNHVNRMIHACIMEAPALRGDVLWVSSVWREPSLLDGVVRGSSSFWENQKSYHQGKGDGHARAIDLRSGLYLKKEDGVSSKRERMSFGDGRQGDILPPISNSGDMIWQTYLKGMAWAERIRQRLGYEFDVIYGIDRNHVDHIHLEHDYKKEMA